MVHNLLSDSASMITRRRGGGEGRRAITEGQPAGSNGEGRQAGGSVRGR